MAKKLLHAAFVNAAFKYPNNIAVVQGDVLINYCQLFEMSYLLSKILKNKLSHIESVITIYMDKSYYQIIAVLGVLMSGSAYLPLDPTFPFNRIKSILNQSGSKIIITEDKYSQIFNQSDELQHVIIIDTIINKSQNTAFYKLKKIIEKSIIGYNSSNLAYVIYTSGTTGAPKGVAITHDAVCNTIEDINNRFNIHENDAVLSLSQLSFDLSVFDVFGLLSCGGKIVLPTKDEQFEPMLWKKLISKENISIWNTVPAFMQMLEELTPSKLPYSLRLILLSGDWIPLELIKNLKLKISENGKIISLGGATEASIWSILYEIEEVDPDWKSIPYGYSLNNQSVEVLDNNLYQCQINQQGEIYIGGIGLAREYYKDIEKTNASFIVHPITQKRLYKTGDYGKYISENKLIEFLGRKDSQVKLNGYRIELAEIEYYLSIYTGIKKSCVIAFQNKLYAFCEIGESIVSLNTLKQYVSSKLPVYMLPKKYFLLKSLPLSTNGKINQNLLKEKYITNIHDKEKFLNMEPITQIWQEILSYSPVNDEDDFFEVGGDSLRAVTLISKINQQLSLELPISLIYQEKTLEKLKKKIDTFDQNEKLNHLLVQLSFQQKKPIFLFHPVSGQIFCYYELTKKLKCHFDVYAIEAILTEHPTSIESMAKDYIKTIQTIQPKGPYYLAGWSIGGLIAYEIAAQLGNSNIQYLGLIDTYPPIQAILNSSFQFKSGQLIKSILLYYYQEISKVIPYHNEQQINFNELCKHKPTKSIDFIFNIIQSTTLQSQPFTVINFAKKFTELFKKIFNAMINYKPHHENINRMTFISAQDTSFDLVSLWQNYVDYPITVEQVNANHIQLLDQKHIDQLCSILMRC